MSRWGAVPRELDESTYRALWGIPPDHLVRPTRAPGLYTAQGVWQDCRRRNRRGSTSPVQRDRQQAETLRREESPASENIHDDAPIPPQREDDNSAARNRTERIQSLQSFVKSSFDDMQAYWARAEREKKKLLQTNKRLKEELKKAKEGEESSKQSLEETRNKLRELRNTFAAVKEQYDKVCDQQGAAPRAEKKRKYVVKILEVNDLLNCSICLEPWAQSGDHIVCSLSCGHFFGKSCITKWILKDAVESRGSSSCPTCSRRVALGDIRHHYLSQIYEE